MKRLSMALSMSVMAGLLALAGCKTGKDPAVASVATPVAVAKQACEVTALAEERDVMITAIDSDAPEAGDTTKEHRWTIVKEKMLAYRAEVDASYRFVTANCNSYNLCMENNNYSEQACAQTRAAWVESQEKFNELSVAINKGKPWRHPRHGGGNNRECHPSNCGTQGGIFSEGCCYDED